MQPGKSLIELETSEIALAGLLRRRLVAALWRVVAVALFLNGLSVSAQIPILSYTLAVTTNDCPTVGVSARLRNLPATFRLAMAKHFVAWGDDEPWRRIEGLEVRPGTINREADGLWRVNAPGRDVSVHYRVRLADHGDSRIVQRPFLSPNGGLLGDEHMFLYVVEAPEAPASVALDLPEDWQIATTLTPTSDPHIFHARNAQELLDSPILAGKLREWRFLVDQTPVRVAYWLLPDAKPFDEKALVGGIQRIVQAASDLFGGLPWPEYVFQLRDGAEDFGLEHFDCATVGLSSAALAASRDTNGIPSASAMTLAHAFFHAWNTMRIHSVEYQGPVFRTTPLSGLWFSEGFTVFYADLLVRRAGLTPDTPNRIEHLQELIADYLGRPVNAICSVEKSSFAAGTSRLGDRQPDIWTQGELIAAMLDLVIRDATDGQRSLDDLMRAMLAFSSAKKGFTTGDVERLTGEICGCNVKSFFDSFVRAKRPPDLDRCLALAGLKMHVKWKKAASPEGTLTGDRRIEADVVHGEASPRLFLWDLNSSWGRAGLHTWDQMKTFNGSPVQTYGDFVGFRDSTRVGETVMLGVNRDGVDRRVEVKIEPYEWPRVIISRVQRPTARQNAVFDRWVEGK